MMRAKNQIRNGFDASTAQLFYQNKKLNPFISNIKNKFSMTYYSSYYVPIITLAILFLTPKFDFQNIQHAPEPNYQINFITTDTVPYALQVPNTDSIFYLESAHYPQNQNSFAFLISWCPQPGQIYTTKSSDFQTITIITSTNMTESTYTMLQAYIKQPSWYSSIALGAYNSGYWASNIFNNLSNDTSIECDWIIPIYCYDKSEYRASVFDQGLYTVVGVYIVLISLLTTTEYCC